MSLKRKANDIKTACSHNPALYFMMGMYFLWLFWGLIIIIRPQNNHKKIHTIMKYNAELCY